MGAKKTWAITAPSLPKPAEMPWPVERTRVGKISAGVMNVVALGPSCVKFSVVQRYGILAEIEEELG